MKPARALLLALVLSTSPSPASTSSSASFRLSDQSFDGSIVGSFDSSSFSVSRVSLVRIVSSAASGSPSYTLEPGFAASYPPPGEVGGSCSGGGATCLTFPDSETLVWPAERSAGTYNLYRGLLSAIVGSGFGECSQDSLTTTTTTDTEAVPSQDGFYYLVTVVNGLGEEGTKGNRSDGGDRLNATPCP